MVRLDPQYRIIFGAGGEIRTLRRTSRRMEQQIAAIAPEDAPGFRRFLDENRSQAGAHGAVPGKRRSSAGRTCSTCAC